MERELILEAINKAAQELGVSETTAKRSMNALLRANIYTVEDFLRLEKCVAKDIKDINVNGKTWKLIERAKIILKEKGIMTVFLSHKMNGFTDSEITEIRKLAKRYLSKKYKGKYIRILDNFHHMNVPEDAGRLWHLGESIKLMEQADAVYFCPGWMNARGCQIEFEICKAYGLKIID